MSTQPEDPTRALSATEDRSVAVDGEEVATLSNFVIPSSLDSSKRSGCFFYKRKAGGEK